MVKILIIVVSTKDLFSIIILLSIFSYETENVSNLVIVDIPS